MSKGYQFSDFRIGRSKFVTTPATPAEKALKKEWKRIDSKLATARFVAEGFEGERSWDQIDPCDGQFDTILQKAWIADITIGGTFFVQTWDGPVTITKVA